MYCFSVISHSSWCASERKKLLSVTHLHSGTSCWDDEWSWQPRGSSQMWTERQQMGIWLVKGLYNPGKPMTWKGANENLSVCFPWQTWKTAGSQVYRNLTYLTVCFLEFQKRSSSTYEKTFYFLQYCNLFMRKQVFFVFLIRHLPKMAIISTFYYLHKIFYGFHAKNGN